MQSIFGTDGIRGRFNEEITYSLAYKVGYALGSNLENNNPILIGRDTRISGDILLHAITKGINASGKKFINLGICPTPAIPFLIKQEQLSSGIMISASHNPPEYNGIKIFDHNGQKITKNFENKIQKFIEESNQNISVTTKEISLKANKELMDIYMKSLIQSMGGENLSGMKIILDTCYGSATTCAKKIFQSLGADVRVLNNSKNGLKINVNCGSTNLEPLKKALRQSPADMGFSFDGDSDRVIGLDSKGNVLDGDHILFLWGRELMEQKILTNNLLISTQMANLGFEEAWNKIGGLLYRTDVGDKYVHDAIKEKRAVLGGEQSGHILSKINNFSGDGILTALQISKYCKKKNITLNNWLKTSFEPFPQKLTNINLNFNINKVNQKTRILINQTTENFQKIYSDNCRIYIRPSGTEPLMRVLVEAKSHKKVDSLSSEIANKLILEINKIMN
ncbi:phosphoglucosamine mutase [Prochlorococcus marinus str. MIT 9312]|uniref:Phosphoglucosamine mutase n=1 Tax=Prochlorococcus marinus (strain MIT 9312) TaxID=74546 RepID=GLMM_PROM9|nr:phosphoglucosamine mutase [Prochlorococcus marinus]Q31CU1.1 RecName: Full=Phosphoglucosamine mutase [Prochlorococcus marinus str. MIT 9312]ABB49304.1 phosphoglucosamine mutase [Prochlorococcus marinus str. MIT 9312]KGG00931.1 Phosphoglucosamine mutase [Prochlorococcus marinus str. MIT 9311]